MQREEIKGLSFFYLVRSTAPVDSSQMKKNIWRKQKGVEQKAGRKLNVLGFFMQRCICTSGGESTFSMCACVRGYRLACVR